MVGAFACDLLKDCVDNRENLNVTVVVDRGHAVGFEVEGVDHVDIVEVSGCSLVSEVDRMLEGQVPDGEGLELRVASRDTALVLVVELGQAGCHLARTGAGSGDDNERAGSFDVLVLAVALVGDDELYIARIACDGVVGVDLDAQCDQTAFERIGSSLTCILGDNDRTDIQTDAAECVDQTQDIDIIGDTQIRADFVLLDVASRDGDDDFSLIGHLREHAHLAVGCEAGQNAGSVVVVEQLAAELQIELAAELCDALFDVFGLHGQIFVVVESNFVHNLGPSFYITVTRSDKFTYIINYKDFFRVLQRLSGKFTWKNSAGKTVQKS